MLMLTKSAGANNNNTQTYMYIYIYIYIYIYWKMLFFLPPQVSFSKSVHKINWLGQAFSSSLIVHKALILLVCKLDDGRAGMRVLANTGVFSVNIFESRTNPPRKFSKKKSWANEKRWSKKEKVVSGPKNSGRSRCELKKSDRIVIH